MDRLARVIAVPALLVSVVATGARGDDGDPARGAEVYRVCTSCHALEPGLHLSGPSLAGVIGRRAGRAAGFVRYSPGLADAGFDWDAAALDGWLRDPQAMIPGTYMAFPGIDDPEARADLVAFLAVAGAPGGAARAVDEGLMPAAYLRGAAPPPLADAPGYARVASIRHCGDSFFIATADGVVTPYWEKNVRLKIDSTGTGPPAHVAVLLMAGMRGDRISVVFAGLGDLEAMLEEKC